ncbi:MAG: Cytochrome oxidase, cbb3-type, subunit [Acidobacteriota bacterium]|nr:Cytochrome oxidase, cbb3-type, subunit [Acidobacteriota bacterium]
MTRLKLGLIALACALIAFACTTNTNTGTATNSTHASNANTTTNAAPANAAANTNAPATNDALASARSTYNNACAKCHKETGEGGVADIDGEKLRVPGFKGGHALKHSDADYVKKINEGGDGMPKFKGRLTPEQIDGLVHFIRTEFQAGTNAAGTTNTNK